MNIMIRGDQLLIARETAESIPPLIQARTLLGRTPGIVGALEQPLQKYNATTETLRTLLRALDATNFDSIIPLVDDDFTRRRARLEALAQKMRDEKLPRAISSGQEPLFVVVGLASDEVDEILSEAVWPSFDQWKDQLGRLIGYLQDLREQYHVRRLDQWGR